VVKTAAGKERGVLTLARPGDVFSPACGALAYFTDEVMPLVLEPTCAQCHVEGGAAAAARLRVTPGDPTATMLSALPLVSAADPASSRILQKPRGDVTHGGGQQIVSGSAEDQVLVHWVDLVVSPACGGGDPGGPTTPASLYADNCASCHGADARGTPGRPDIHCHRSIHDVVRRGRTGGAEDMPAFPDLSDEAVSHIQGHLLTLCSTDEATGEALYASNCTGCHGADATGAVGPSVRCATRVRQAVRTGRADVMPAFPMTSMPDVEVDRLVAYLDARCTTAGRPAADLYAGNCSTCHGAMAGGGRSALGVRGPGIRCTGLGDYLEKVREGDGEMPSFPALDDGDVGAIRAWVFDGFCTNP
jgi:mono/diheme cytochrome c family protein